MSNRSIDRQLFPNELVPLVYKDVDFQNKVRIGTVLPNGQTLCSLDLNEYSAIEQIKAKVLVFYKNFILGYYNTVRVQQGFPEISEQECLAYVLERFNQPGYAVQIGYSGGIYLFYYRDDDAVYLASMPIITKELPEKIEKPLWQKFLNLFGSKKNAGN